MRRLRVARVAPALALCLGLLGGLALICRTALAAPSLTLLVSAAPSHASSWRATLGDARATPPDLFGVNGKIAHLDHPWQNPALQQTFAASAIPILRYPAGTIGNYWDWERGWIDPDIPDEDFVQFWLIPVRDATQRNPLADLQPLAALPGRSILMMANLLTHDFPHALSALHRADLLGIPVPRIELGNELYIDSDPLATRLYPTASDYARVANAWAAALKAESPNVQVAVPVAHVIPEVVGNPAYARLTGWNAALLPLLSSQIDALALHLYRGTSISPEARTVQLWGTPAEQEAQYAALSTPAGVAGLLAQPAAVYREALELGGLLTVPRAIWITEWNLVDYIGPTRHTWAHGLYVANAIDVFLSDPRVANITLHNIGDTLFGAFFIPPLDAYFSGLRVGGIDPQTLTDRITPYAPTAAGRVLSLFARASSGADAATRLAFTAPSDHPAGSAMPSEASPVWGWAFTDRARWLTRLLLANTGAQAIGVTLDDIGLGVDPRGKPYYQISAAPTTYIVNDASLTTATGVVSGALELAPYSLTMIELSLAVNTTADTPDLLPGDGTCADGTGACSLRAAIQEANAAPPFDIILAPAGIYTLTLTGADEDAAASGDLDLHSDAAIYGAGAGATIVDGASADRVFDILTGSVRLAGLTIRGGAATNGGGIRNAGALMLVGSEVLSNTALVAPDGEGGGIVNTETGQLIVQRTTIVGNRAATRGGGLSSRGPATIISSAIVSNSAEGKQLWPAAGGGGMWLAGQATVTNSTISGNQAAHHGGGLLVDGGRAAIDGGTIVFNDADSDADGLGNGGGIRVQGASDVVTFTHTILAGNRARGRAGPTADCNQAAAGALRSGGYNLTGAGAGCPSDGAGDRTMPSGAVLGQGVLPLDASSPPVHPLAIGSPALDVGPCDLADDQRGAPRPANACDSGAYEWQPVDLAIAIYLAGGVAVPGHPFSYTLAFANRSRDAIASAVAISHAIPIPLTDVHVEGFMSDGRVYLESADLWQMGDLAPGARGAITVAGVISADLAGEAVFTLTAAITPTAGTADANAANNLRRARVRINWQPTADAGGPYRTTVGTPLTLDGSGSHDRGGDIRYYLWDLDGDGIHDDARGITTTATFTTSGVYTISLRVIDDDQAWDADTAVVHVVAGREHFLPLLRR
jgi:CSLREA domain-containing protein